MYGLIKFCKKINASTSHAKCTKSAHRGTGTIYDSFVLISGAFVWSRLIYEGCLHLTDTYAYRSVHNNLFLTLHVIRKLKSVALNLRT